MEIWAVIYTPNLFNDDVGTLIGRLLVRVLLKGKGISVDEMKFATTPEGKPYIKSQTNPPLAYNITHDNNLVAMAFAPGIINQPAYNVGIDVMKVRIPGRETFDSFVHTVGDQLTTLEHVQLKAVIPETEKLKRFFWMWTLKEAYTKALGIGLGFDFRRIEFDVVARRICVDGKEPEGWQFNMFNVQDGEDLYQCVVAEYVGDTKTEVTYNVHNPEWFKVYGAVQFTEMAVGLLKT
ncbi:4'-phosphopantetheinyl transferase pptA [Psilocybe cubensis]|uniref:4'-phosphopantetheinyl transferase pptA n=2 Tax=Psilocybe cubensis TaxID=181762 RepID=A0ACB8H443_PSICU|nr:4'-phosphopantetheinyl transferase pptA [Psilocybe cubensis]KAH9482619.1 4'-phosphopantetheinyl transferase pptA [Psilocybe cubensis]